MSTAWNVHVNMSDGTTNEWRVDNLDDLTTELRYTVKFIGNIDSITIDSPEVLL